jgi:hypothetical protein|tara:strand:- start:128 stop:1240 length:1113 start_codon:yes stop_codon:yes gene_type:complete
MNVKTIDVAGLFADESLNSRIDLLVAVKSFDLQAIQKRYIESLNRSKTGSVSRREPALGGLVHIVIEDGKIVLEDHIAKLREPRGISINNDKIAISSENRIFIFDQAEHIVNVIDHPWLSYIHTVRFNHSGSHFLVSSSGLDMILEFNLIDKICQWEWLAWENGINIGYDPSTNKEFRLTRSQEKADEYQKNGIDFRLINEPKKQHLPTALRAAFINSAEYAPDGYVLATLFHSGSAIKISKFDGSWNEIIKNLSKPHGCMTMGDEFLITDTGGGNVIVFDNNRKNNYSFKHVDGKSNSMSDLEWLQFSTYDKQIIITEDSNRKQFTIIDRSKLMKLNIKHNPNWAIQEFAILNDFNVKLLNQIKNYFKH